MAQSRFIVPTRVLLVFTATLHLTGCMTTDLRPRMVQPVSDSIVLADFDPAVTLHHPRLEGDSIHGWRYLASGDSVRMGVTNEVEVRRVSAAGSLLVVVGIGVAVIAIAVSRMQFGGGWGSYE